MFSTSQVVADIRCQDHFSVIILIKLVVHELIKKIEINGTSVRFRLHRDFQSENKGPFTISPLTMVPENRAGSEPKRENSVGNANSPHRDI